ncbi:hypothetical protein BU15DRAFT_67860 [Melanogaster broomeanus]|nr:hypothetical protein BU15DRAFT_67860 [Melanogaster broomeanus]
MAPCKADTSKSSGPSAKDNILTTCSGRAFSGVVITQSTRRPKPTLKKPGDSNLPRGKRDIDDAFNLRKRTCHKSKQAQSDDDEPDDSNDEDQPRIENAHNPSSAAKCPHTVQSDDKQADLDIDKEPHTHKDNGDESHRITKTDAIIKRPSSKSNSKRRAVTTMTDDEEDHEDSDVSTKRASSKSKFKDRQVTTPSDDEQSDKSDNDGHLPPSSPPPLPSEDEGDNTEDYNAVENAVAGDLDNSGPDEEAMDDEQGSDGLQPEAWESDPSGSNYSLDVRQKKKASGTGTFSPEAEEDDQREVDDRQALTKPSHRKKASKQTIKAGAKRHRKSTALLSDIDVSKGEGDDITLENDKDDELDGGEGAKVRSGPLSQPAQVECEALGKEIEEKVKALAAKYHKSPRVILENAALVAGFTRKESLWNIHQSWFCATQSKDDEDAADVKQRQKDEYMQIKNLPDDAPQWVPALKYWKEMHNTIDTGPKTAAGRVICIRDLFSKSGFWESLDVTWDVQGDRLGCPNILGHPEIVWVTHCTWNTPRGVRGPCLGLPKNPSKIQKKKKMQQAVMLLRVPAEELGDALTHKMSYIHKELFTVLLNVKQAPIGETPTQIVLLDQASFQTKGPMDTGAPLPLG